MLYSADDLQQKFTPDVLRKADLILEQGRVTHPAVSRNGEVLTSLVKREGERDYRVYVRLEGARRETFSIHGECSCDGYGDCEHIAAVLLLRLQNETDLTETAAPAQAGTRRAPARRHDQQESVPQRLLYQLRVDPEKGHSLLLETSCVRLLKSGGFGARKAYRPGWAARGRPPGFLRPEDQGLLARLDAIGADPRTGMSCLRDAGSDDLLEEIVATGRCVLADRDVILHRARDRRLSLSWEIDDAARQYPAFHAQPGAPLLVLLTAPWYFDPDTGACGKLVTDLPYAWLVELFEKPRIEAHRVEQTEAAWAKRYPGASLPPLRRFEIEERSREQPVPCLRFCSEVSEDPWLESRRMDMVRLSFDYAGICLTGDQPSQVRVGERVIMIRRERAFEQGCVERLLEAGLVGKQWWRDKGIDDSFVVSGDAEEWFGFQAETLPELRQQGWRIEYDRGFAHRLTPIEGWYGEIRPRESQAWFDASLGVLVEGERINLLPPLVDLIRKSPKVLRQEKPGANAPGKQLFVPVGDGQVLPLPMERVRNILSTLFEIYDDNPLDEDGWLRLSRTQLARLAELDDKEGAAKVHWTGAEQQQGLLERLRGVAQIPMVDPPEGLTVCLRDYQMQGLSWLQFLHEHDLAGILADDMGLGKTVQTLAHLLLEKERGRLDRPALVVAPTSLMVNWRREAARFTPGLKVLTLHGPKRSREFRRLGKYDLVLTTYALLARDREALSGQAYHLLILDEAQLIKNPNTHASRLVRQLETRHRLCLTGTPLENHLGELWSLFDFLLPGLLGNPKQFARVLKNPIEKHADEEASGRLAQRVRPFMLRRTKQQVARDLPPKTEIVQSVELSGGQRDLYESVRLAMHDKVRQAIANQGMERSHIIVLDALLKLRQVCCDPRLVKLESAAKVKSSAKLELLMEMLPEMIEEGRRILLFSQFTGMLKLIEEAVRSAGIRYVKLTGSTRDRAAPVERFQKGRVPLFLISLKAGGVGLNLTAADTVIHYDPWWNPAVERQASDRAHRIGQDNPVFVYRLITTGSVEERIQEMQLQKQALADSLFDRHGGMQAAWSEADLDTLFEPLE